MTNRTSRALLSAVTVALAVLAGCAALLIAPVAADAAVLPPVQQPSSSMVTADALPAPQIEKAGVVWKQLVVGNTVFVAGKFTTARPFGAPEGDPSQTTHNGLLAYDITTGALLPNFHPSLTTGTDDTPAQAFDLAVSPNGSTLYVVGDFTKVDGQGRNRLAAFNTADGSLIATGFSGGLNGPVYAVTATAGFVYVGGLFNTAGGVDHARLAAFTSAGSLTAWNPSADYKVNGLTVSQSGSKIVVAGAFTKLNGANVFGIGAVDAVTGASMSWATNQKVQSYGTDAGFTSVTNDGSAVYVTSYNFHGTGNIEGTVSTNPETGVVNWIEDCHGDTYGAFGVNGAVYAVGHPHYCGNLGGWPDYNPRQWRRAVAFSHDATGVLTKDTTGYPSHTGEPAPSIINWFPDLLTGEGSGQNQAAWSVTGNSNYIVLGGEFPTVNGIAQQGLARFATRAVVTHPRSGPRPSGSSFVPSVTNVGPGKVRIAFQANWDRDSATLNYAIVRDGTTVWTGSSNGYWWSRPMLGFIDDNGGNGVPAGATYHVVVTDPDNNVNVSPDVTIGSTDGSSPLSDFDNAILADTPTNYWPLSEGSSPAVVRDRAGFADMDAGTGVTAGNTAGPFSGKSATSFNGTSSGLVLGRYSVPAANTITVSAWIKTTTTSGGRIVGLGNNPTVTSTTGDRMLYMDNSGRVSFGIINSSLGKITVRSPGALNNGGWHQLVGTYGSNTMGLWVDGVLVDQKTGVAPADPGYNGWWRIGYDDLAGWPNVPSSDAFQGAIASVAVYPAVLIKSQIVNQYVASGRVAPGGAPAGTYVALKPARVLDTRNGIGTTTRLGARGTVALKVLGAGGVPRSGVSAVVLNVTATQATAGGFVTVYPNGDSRPGASNINFVKGQTVPNLVMTQVGDGGIVNLYNGSTGSTQLIADVSGYYTGGVPTEAGTFQSLTPARLLDTRNGTTPGARGTVALQVTGRGGVPSSGVSAVVLNVTVTRPASSGFVTVYGHGTTRPGASNLNFVAGQTVPNLVVAPVVGGKVDLYNGSTGKADLLADVAGYFIAGTPSDDGAFKSLTPARVLDTRNGGSPGPRGTVHLKVTGVGGVPASGVSAVILNVTATRSTAAGFLTVYAHDSTKPDVSNLNFVKGQTVPNLVVAPVGSNGIVDIYNGSTGNTQILADVAGYYLNR